jgi:hypothetical protein
MRTRALAAVPPALLAVVACVQIGLARLTPLTPWKGGGFGMFATTDGASNRETDVLVTGPERSQELEVPPSLADAAASCEAFPIEPCLAALARGLADRERRHGQPVWSVRVRVWRTEFAPVTLEPRRRLLGEHLLTEPGAHR